MHIYDFTSRVILFYIILAEAFMSNLNLKHAIVMIIYFCYVLNEIYILFLNSHSHSDPKQTYFCLFK